MNRPFLPCTYFAEVTSVSRRLSFSRIIQSCNHCGKRYIWESQPFVGKIPARNIYAGALPAKSLRILKILNLVTISIKTFFRHQNTYLQPATHSVWKHHQEQLLEQLKRAGKALVLAGDGRADSPGHSAKYGSYSVLDLTSNKIVGFKLVQVLNLYLWRIVLWIDSYPDIPMLFSASKSHEVLKRQWKAYGYNCVPSSLNA